MLVVNADAAVLLVLWEKDDEQALSECAKQFMCL